MKRIIAIIPPLKVDEVRDALMQAGVAGITLTEVMGFGQQRGHTEVHSGAEYADTLLPKVQVEAVVPADLLDRAVRAIMKSAHSGKFGDGKIFVDDITLAMRIRTGETGDAAL